MDGKGNRNAGWMRLYQLIACAGVVLALIPATEFLALFCARQLSGVVAMLAVPVLVALGYGVQKLLLIGWRAGEMDFSFESHTEFPPLGRRIPAWGISALAGLLAGAGVRDLMAWRLGAESNSEVGGAVVLLYRFAHDPAKTRAMLAVLSARLYDFFAGILYVFGISVGRRRGGEPDADEVTEHYRDTVTRVRRAPQSVPCRDRRALERALRREKGNDAKFCLAYRALLAALAADGIGLTPTMTPYEAADVIRERTDMVQMDGWTAQFVSLTYAKGETHTTNADLKNLCACLYRRMQTADGGGA